jgi:hypothetical protein
MTLRVFLYDCWLFVYRLWRNVHSNLLKGCLHFWKGCIKNVNCGKIHDIKFAIFNWQFSSVKYTYIVVQLLSRTLFYFQNENSVPTQSLHIPSSLCPGDYHSIVSLWIGLLWILVLVESYSTCGFYLFFGDGGPITVA